MTTSYFVRCDQCDKDITTTTNYVDYRIEVRIASRSPASERATAFAKCPPSITGDFCGDNCLIEYVKTKTEKQDD